VIPHKQSANIRHTFLEAHYNQHRSKGKNVVENAFGILKKELLKIMLVKRNLRTFFLLDDVTCCLLYNMILDGGALMFMH
jgi:hypothetical protein